MEILVSPAGKIARSGDDDDDDDDGDDDDDAMLLDAMLPGLDGLTGAE